MSYIRGVADTRLIPSRSMLKNAPLLKPAVGRNFGRLRAVCVDLDTDISTVMASKSKAAIPRAHIQHGVKVWASVVRQPPE
jgi:hypothetical protein